MCNLFPLKLGLEHRYLNQYWLIFYRQLFFTQIYVLIGLNGAPSNALSVILCLVLPMFTLCFYFN